jgi:hypothetical protein
MSLARLQSRSPRRLQSRSPANLSSRSSGQIATLAAVLVCALLALAPQARADIGETIILRCTHAQSISGYSQSDYRKALNEIEADTEEYGSCGERIRHAQEAAASSGASGSGGAGGTGGAGGGATPVALTATPAQQRALSRAASARPESIALGGHVIHPGVVHVDVASALSHLPSSLIATLAFLLACVLATVGVAVRNRVRGRTR